MTRRIFLFVVSLVLATSLAAQDDRTAGLFAEATQLPLVGQSVVTRIQGGEAIVTLTQVFANPGAEIAQADYRLHLPTEALITGFGFWSEGRFMEATLKERDQARREHTAAAGAGRATGLLQRDGTIHSFSVFPVLTGRLQEVEVTLVLPVSTERGRSHVRLPLDHFIGHAAVSSSVIAHLESSEPLRSTGVHGAVFVERKRQRLSTELVFTTEEPVEIWWAAEAPPLLARAESVPLADGRSAIQLRLALNDVSGGGLGPSEIVLLIDASASMRRRGDSLPLLMDRILDQATVPVRVFAIAEETREITDDDRRTLVSRLLSGEVGFSSHWEDLRNAGERLGCGSTTTRCVVVTDPQLPGLPAVPKLETLFLADADELAHFSDIVGSPAPVYQTDVEPTAKLHALADELVLPVLELRSIRQGSGELTPVGSPRLRVAMGGLMRLFFNSPSQTPLSLELAVDGRPVEREISIDELDPLGRDGRAVRRGFYRGRLADWMNEYRRSRDPGLRGRIVELSLHESIPTALTSLHVASPDRVLSRTATPAPLLRRVGLVILLAGVAALVFARMWTP